MADIAREMEEFEAANRTFNGEWKPEMKGSSSSSSSSNQPSSDCSITVPDHPSQPVRSSTRSTGKGIDKYGKSSKVQWGIGGDRELKRQRRVAKYKSYAVERKLKSSIKNGVRWIKIKYCEFVHGY